MNFSPRLAYRDRTQNRGQLEICLDDTWQSVCEGSFSLGEANVACRQLGFNAFDSTENEPSLDLTFQLGTGPSLLELDLFCTGEEQRLEQCQPQRRRRRELCPDGMAFNLACLGMVLLYVAIILTRAVLH